MDIISKFNSLQASRLLKLLTVASLFLASSAYGQWHSGAAVPTPPAAVNFISGVPLTSTDDPEGGFGDIAANVNTAIEMKKRFPSMTVNLLVTSEWVSRPGVRNSNEIVHIMFPQLNPNLKGVAQTVSGVNFIFLSEGADLLEDLERMEGPHGDLARLKREVPKADLSIQLSANRDTMEAALLTNTKMGLTFFEPGEAQSFLDGVLASRTRPTDEVPLFSMNAGIGTFGYYLERGVDGAGRRAARERVSKFLQNQNLDPLRQEESLLFAYSKYQTTSEAYVKAVIRIAEDHPDRQFRLVMKQFAGMHYPELPFNLEIDRAGVFPHTTVHDLIVAADYSPLVTGDTSLSIALSSTTADKAFVYEVPAWKAIAAGDLFEEFRSRSGEAIGEAEFDRLFVFEPNRMTDPSDITQAGEAMYLGMTGKPNLSKVHHTRLLNMNRWDLIQNVFHFLEFYRKFELEFANGFMTGDYREFVLGRLRAAGDWQRTLEVARALLKDKPHNRIDRLYNALLVLKLADGLTDAEQELIVETLGDSYLYDGPGNAVKNLGIIVAKPLVQSVFSKAIARNDSAEFVVRRLLVRLYAYDPHIEGLSTFYKPYWEEAKHCNRDLLGY